MAAVRQRHAQRYRKPHQLWARWFDLALINRIKKIDRWDVDDTSLRHCFLEIDRSSEVLCHLRVLGVEDDHNLTLIAVGGVVDARITEACSLLHFGMPIENRTPLAVVPYLMPD